MCIYDVPEHLAGLSRSRPLEGPGSGTKNRKRVVAIFLLVSFSLFTLPGPAHGSVGISFDILSVGPLSFGVDIALEDALPLAALFFAGKILFSFFSGDSGAGSNVYSASYSSENIPSTPVMVTSRVTVNKDDHLHGDPIRMKYGDFVHGNRINLARGAYLEIADDGKLAFKNSPFSGYAYIHYDHSLSVWDDQGNPVLVVVPKGEQTVILQEKSPRASEVLSVLFGAAPKRVE
jgi:hypothetical protein